MPLDSCHRICHRDAMKCCTSTQPGGPLLAPTAERENPWCAICGAEFRPTPLGWERTKLGRTEPAELLGVEQLIGPQ